MHITSLSRTRLLRTIAIPLCLLFVTATALAAAITGTVTNRTTNKPSAGDTVVLIRLSQGMMESTRTTTDRSGHYTLDVPDTDGVHLVRVTHQGANYFQPAPPGTQTVNVEVYDVAPKLEGVHLEADVLRMDTDGDGLRVIESFFIKNVSSPPRTQLSAHPFEFYLPAGAQISGSAALGPGSMPVQSAPVPMGDPGHYTFIFPLRPGETRFQVSYHLPYSGSQAFTPKLTMATDNFVVILPKTMQFVPSSTAGFQPVNEDVNDLTFLAKNLKPASKLDFKISGSGQLQDTQNSGQQQAQAGAQQGGPEAASASTDTRPGGGLGTPIDTPDPLTKYRWWILGLVGALLAAGAGIMLRQPAPLAAGTTAAGVPVSVARGNVALSSAGVAGADSAKASVLLLALKEELFALETERLDGRLPQEEYDRQKAALEIVLKRALDRNKQNAAPKVG